MRLQSLNKPGTMEEKTCRKGRKIKMTEGFQIVSNRCDRSACDIRFLNQQVADKATAFHSSFPQYHPTPLRRLQALAGQMGVGEIFVKDESYRFGLTHSRCWAVRLPSGNISRSGWAGTLASCPIR